MIMLTIINALFFRILSLVFFILPDDAFDCLWEVFTTYFLENFVESPPIVTGSQQLTPASNAITTGVEPKLCPCCPCEEELQNRIFLNQLELEVQNASEQIQKNRRNATEPNLDSEESNNEDEPSAQLEKNAEAEAESPSISEYCEVKPTETKKGTNGENNETHTKSNGTVEAPLIPDTFEDPHVCCATCSPIPEPVGLMPEATSDQETNNGHNTTKETSDLTKF